MRTARQRGRIAAQELMRPLRAGLHPFEAVCNRIIDRLVVAGFEMQERDVFAGAPVAPEQGALALEIQGGRNRPLSAPGHNENNGVTHRLAYAAEEFARKIGSPPLLTAGANVESEERVPMTLGDCTAREPVEFDSPRADRGAFLAQRPAARRGKVGEKFLE